MRKISALILALLMSKVWAQQSTPIPGPKRTPGDLQEVTEEGEFPASDLPAAVQTRNTVRLRRHAWSIFAGLTSQDDNKIKAPIFLTWFTKANLFAEPPSEDKGKFGLEPPKQVVPLSVAPVATLSKVFFNLPAARAIVDGMLNTLQPPGVPSPTQPERVRLNCAFGDTRPEDRHIKDFPAQSVVLKTVWRLVSAGDTKPGELTAIPVWDPESNTPGRGGNNPDLSYGPEQWSRYVAVNTHPDRYKGLAHALVRPKDSRNVQQAPIVPLDRFYYKQIDSGILAEAQRLNRAAKLGDYFVLVGLHVTTKEIPNWFWITFWWHDHPDAGPFAANRPSSVLGPWRNYLMNISYDMEFPEEADGSPHVNFNPYLEGLTPGGLKTNCMTCHRLSTSPGLRPDTTPGTILDSDPRFDHRLKMGFLWSLTDFGGSKDPAYDPKSCPPRQ